MQYSAGQGLNEESDHVIVLTRFGDMRSDNALVGDIVKHLLAVVCGKKCFTG